MTALSYVDPQAANITAYYYAVIIQADGDKIVTSPIWYTRSTITATTSSTDPLALTLFPNPTTATATLSYYLPTAATVSAEVFNAVGRRVVTIVEGASQAAGPHTLSVPVLQAGLYNVRLLHDGVAEYRKLVVE